MRRFGKSKNALAVVHVVVKTVVKMVEKSLAVIGFVLSICIHIFSKSAAQTIENTEKNSASVEDAEFLFLEQAMGIEPVLK